MNRSMQIEEMTTRTNRGNRTITTTTTTTTSNEMYSLDDDIGEVGELHCLDNSAAKHRISVRPARNRRSPSVSENVKARQEKEATIRELIETEEEFVRDLKYLITNYIRWTDEGTSGETCKGLAQHSQFLFGGIADIHEFHKTVLLEGIKYYQHQPNQIGRSFTRLERDFDKHSAYIDRMEGIADFLLDHPKVNECFDNRSIELGDTGRTLIDYVRLPLQRLNDYSLLLSELIKFSKQLGEPTHDLEKGLELVNWIPNKSRDIKFIQSIEGFGDTRAGRILKHDWFRLSVGGRDKERYCFLFKNKLLVTKVRRISPDRSVFILKDILQLPEYQLLEFENSIPEDDVKEQGKFGLKDKHGTTFIFQSEPAISSGWVKDIREFTTTFADEEPIKKRGRVLEAAESVTINGVEITDVTTPNDENLSFSIEQDSSFVNVKNTTTTTSHRIVDIPIQVESGGANDSYSDESIRNEYNKQIDLYGTTVETTKTSVEEIIHEIQVDDGDNSTSVEQFVINENGVQKNIVRVQEVESSVSGGPNQTTTRQTKTIIIDSEIQEIEVGTDDDTVQNQNQRQRQVQIEVESEEFERLENQRAEEILEKGARLLQQQLEAEELLLKKEKAEQAQREAQAQEKLEEDERLQKIEQERQDKLEKDRQEKLAKELEEKLQQEAQEKLEAERVQKLEQERQRLEEERLAKLEQERQKQLEKERVERELQEKLEEERLAKLEQERARLEKERLEKLEKERQEKLERERVERELQEKLEEERLQKLEQERQRLEEEHLAKLEKERQEKLEQERQEQLEREKQQKLEEERQKAEQEKERQRQLEEERLQKLEEERQIKLEEERQLKLEEERQLKLEEERQLKLEEERQQKLQEERQKKAEEEEARRQQKLEKERQQKLKEEEEEKERQAQLEKERQEELEREKAEKKRQLEQQLEEEKRAAQQAQAQTQAPSEPERLAKDKLQRKASIKLSKDSSHKNLIRMDSTSNADGELKPGFTLNVKSVEVEPGDNATLIVETSSSSPSIVTWLKENKPLDDRLADRVKIVSKDNVHTLTLLNCSDEDSGLYTAKCSNQYGNACSSGFISVHEFTPEERQRKSLERMPDFLIKMKDAELLRETTLCFIAKPTGDPAPTVKFLKDGVELEEDERIFIGRSGDLVELTIRNVTDSDVGTYSIVAKNKYGEAETQGNLTLTDEKSMFPGLTSQLLEPGEEPEFSWYRDGVKFSPEDKFKVLFKDDEDSLALVFQHVRPEDAGLYTCVASTSSGRISCSAELTVQGAIHQLLREPEPPAITAELTDTEVSTGGSAMLELKVTGFPKPEVSWAKDGTEIEAGGRFRFLYEDDESIALIIKGVKIEDAGQYVVTAKNDLGDATTSGRLLVNSPPKFKAKMQDTACMTDEPFTMSVAVEGSPLPQVKWYKDGQLIIESERIQMTRSDDGVFTITFEKITLEDGGNYSVVASNSIGQMSEFWNLVANSRARFTKTIESSIEIKEKETREFSVEVEGNPAPEVKWLIDNKEVAKGLEYKYKCTSRTEEKITAQAINAFGSDECSSSVKVLRSPKIQGKLNDATVQYNKDASFTVKVDEYPKGKVSWFIDGIEIDGKKYEKVDEGNTHTLKIHGVTGSAKVKVKAENEYGYDEQEARLDVIRKPEITRPLEESYTEVEQKTLKLSVDVSANPDPDVLWFHNGQQVDADARIKIHREGTETWSLTFNVLLPSDSGDWSVKTTNEAGEAESKTVVIVEGKPVFEKKLIETVECVESDSVAFEVKVQGSPNPVIQWSLNSEELTVSTRTSIETNNNTRSTTTSKLVINSTLLEDSGQITCVARNEHGSCETSTQLIVTPSGPKLKVDASPRIVEKGQPLKLSAGVTEGAKIKWLADGKEIGKGASISFTPDKDAIVKCVATDDKGQEDSVDIPVRVMSLPKITGLKDVNCGPGDSVTLSPKIESELDSLTVSWSKDGKDGEKAKVKDCKEGDYTLKLDNVQPKDVGKYTITARNAVGETTASAKLSVLVEPPSFPRGLADLKLREGEPLSLRVRVMGLPEPTVVWEKDGKKLENVEVKDGAYEFHSEGIKLSEFGTYTVKAENVAGKAETTGKVVLIEEKPLVTKGPERSKTVEETEPLTLSAIVSGSPIPAVKWLKDGEPINLEPGRVEVTTGPGGAQKLVIAKAEKLDDGVYTLVAENPLGTVKSSPSQVTVIPLPVLPTVKISAPAEATHGSDVTLKVEVTGEPSPKLTLFENDKPVEPLRTIKGDKNNPNVITYILKAPSKGAKVTYSAVVTNPSGKGNDEVVVKLSAPPSAPVVIENLPATKSAVEGTPLKLTSVLSGTPLPSVQWLRDNVPVPSTTTEVDGKLHTSVLLDGAGTGDAGVYTLVAENPSGKEQQKCDVSVLGAQDDSKPLEAPGFSTTLPESIIVNEGDELVLSVGVTGNPLPKVEFGRIADKGQISGADDDGQGTPISPAKAPAVTDAAGEKPKKAEVSDDSGIGKGKAVAGTVEDDGSGDKAKVGDAGDDADKKGSASLDDGAGAPGAGLEKGEISLEQAAPSDEGAKASVSDGDGATPSTPTVASAPEKSKAKAKAGALPDDDSSKSKPLVTDGPTLEPLSSVYGPGAKVDESFDGKNAVLRVPGMRHGYEGPVSVKLTNPLGTKTATVNVGVRKVYTPARITDKFNDIHQVRGGDAKFTAKITGDPRPDVTWKYNGKVLPQDAASSKYAFKWDGKTASLTVRNVADSDLGKYTLHAENIEGSDECSAVLKEIDKGAPASQAERGEKPYFLKKIANTEVYDGVSVKFTACVGGFPEPEFHWFFTPAGGSDDQTPMRIYPGGRYTIENNENGLLRLVIAKAGVEDVGVYTLKIFNKCGEDQCQANCTAEDFHVSGSAKTEPKVAVPRVPGPPNPLPDKPIISSMTDRHLCLSWKPALRTHIDYPVTYIVEMCPADTNEWFKLRSGIKGCVTEVRNLEPGLDYKFRIRVENRVGVSEPSPYAQALRSKFDWRPTPWTPRGGDYDLNRPPHPGFTHPPKFLNENKEQYGVPGCGIGVEWWLYGFPKPSVTFFFNGEEISSSDHVFDTNGRVILYIDKLSESRQGFYECVAVNDHGTDRYTIHVLIGEHPKWVIRLQETHILERRDGKLSGLVTAKPQPDFKWYKDWTTLAETSRIKFIVAETEPWTYRVTMTLNDSIMKDHGLYSCTASNVVGTASSSANIHIEEFEDEWRFKSYNKRLSPISLKNRSPKDFYTFGDEIGRGTQGVTRHATGLQNGVSVAIKSMESGDAGKREWMRNEFNIHSDLFHPGITRVSDGYQDERGVHIVSDICTGGDIVGNCISRGGFSEHQVSDYIRQLLLSLDYLHNSKSVAHLGINPFDILFSHEDSDTIKLVDFGLSRRITSKLERLDFGHPEFASPESLNGEGVGYSHDLWSIGIITYLLLNGTTPFLGGNDQETIENVKTGKWELLNKGVSESAQDFLRKLLSYDPRGRLDVRRALEHPWISKYFSNSNKKITSSLQTYRSSLQKWYENASCRTVYRRNPWSNAYTHASKMIYPPGEIDYELSHGSRDPKSFNFGVPNYPRPDLNVEVGVVKSESHYQNGPDTYLLQLRDSEFPARLRQYMKVAASRSPSFALQLKSQAYDRNNPIIRERRRFTDVMDEEVKDERVTQGQEWRGEPRRLRHEVGLHLDTTAQADAIIALHKDGTAGFIREGPPPIVRANVGDTIIIPCVIGGSPSPIVQWFKNDLVMGPTPRIKPDEMSLKISNFNETDFGLYKLSVRTNAGSHTVKFRIVQGHYTAPPPSNLDYSGIEANKIVSESSSLTYNELITSGGQFGQWSLGSAEDGHLAQRLSSPVDDLKIKSSLAHTGLLRLKSLVNDSNHTYFVYHETTADGYCKLVDKFIREGVYSELEISDAVQQILSVLSYVQWRGLQLMNINLDNILIDTHGNVKLFDTSSVVQVTKIGSVLPIPSVITQFTPPEVLAGDHTHLTTDIWAIGCVVYTLLSGTWPFAGEDGKQTRSNIQFVRYRFEPLYVGSTPEATRFLMMIFKKCPLKRPTIEEVLESRWLGTQEREIRKRSGASFKSGGLEKLLKSSSFIVS